MKFTAAVRKYWRAIQKPGKRGDEASRRWDIVADEARRSLGSLRGHLSKQAFKFFADSSFHDGSVVSIKVLDKESESSISTFRRRRFPTNVEVVVLHPLTRISYTLNYRRVRHITLETPSSEWLGNDADQTLFEWGYDRLSMDKRGTLRHEILFSSGAALELSFEQLILKRDQATTDTLSPK